MANPVVLRDLLRDKHWQTYATFCREYDKAAVKIDPSYVGTYPSRTQLHRWTSGDLRGMPYPQHCEVLEIMFPGVAAPEMFVPSPRSAADPRGISEAEIGNSRAAGGSDAGAAEAGRGAGCV